MVDRLVSLGVVKEVAQKAQELGLDLPAIIRTVEEKGVTFVNKHLSEWLGIDIK